MLQQTYVIRMKSGSVSEDFSGSSGERVKKQACRDVGRAWNRAVDPLDMTARTLGPNFYEVSLPEKVHSVMLSLQIKLVRYAQ